MCDILSKIYFANNITRQNFKTKYLVNDVCNLSETDCNIIFILESPYTDEVNAKHPLAGKSGISVSKLFGKDEAIGKLVKEQRINNIGIFNVSNIPMDISAYKCSDLRKGSSVDIVLINWLRKRIGSNKKSIDSKFQDCKEEKKEIIDILVEDLKKRLEPLFNEGNKNIFVPCGNVAQAFFEKIEYPPYGNKVIILNIPHPSRNQWTDDVLKKLSENEDIKKIIETNKQEAQNGKND
ncbi:MAG: hypothetical protein K9I71_08630 [Ignavibacteriales bacterium]|nr:hypothetical protein [Ignavibacteriales bacterium]MCF8316177.1 hypothetical protein [Ignavibacteriales bacterium]MCF8436679.1 hypothetical protein [Ignavibacteriales bacterium]